MKEKLFMNGEKERFIKDLASRNAVDLKTTTIILGNTCKTIEKLQNSNYEVTTLDKSESNLNLFDIVKNDREVAYAIRLREAPIPVSAEPNSSCMSDDDITEQYINLASKLGSAYYAYNAAITKTEATQVRFFVKRGNEWINNVCFDLIGTITIGDAGTETFEKLKDKLVNQASGEMRSMLDYAIVNYKSLLVLSNPRKVEIPATEFTVLSTMNNLSFAFKGKTPTAKII